MKTKSLLFASLLLSAVAVAQNKPSVGIRAGLSSAEMKGDAVNSFKETLNFTGGALSPSRRNGFFAGGYVNIPVSEKISIEPGLYYAQKGYEVNGTIGSEGGLFSAKGTARLNSQYIDLPVVVKGTFNGFQVFAGPQVSYLANAELLTRAGALGFNVVNNTSDVTNEFNRLDVALTGGIGYQFGNGMNITAAYDHGLSRVNSGQNLESYNRAFKVGVGFKF